MNTAVALPLRPSRPGALCGLISATLSAICPDKIPSWTTYIPWIVKYVSMIVFIILFNRFISLAKETHVCSVVSQPLCQYLCWDRSVLSLIASKKKKKCLFNLSLCCCLDPLIIPLSSIMEQAFICESVIESQRTYWITHVLIPDSRIKLHALCNCHHACSASPSVCAVKRNPPCILIKYTAVSQYYLPFGFILTWIRISQTHTWTHFQMSTNPWMWAKWENNPPRIWSA